MWKLFDGLNSYTELLKLNPSSIYSQPRVVQNDKCGNLIEHTNRLAHIHTDECWKEQPPQKIYLYCEKAGEGGESLIGNFHDVKCSHELRAFLERFEFTITKFDTEYSFKIINNGIFKLHQTHRELANQIKSQVMKNLFVSYIDELKKNTTVIKLLPNQGLIVDNQTSFHGRLNFEGSRKLIKVLGYENTCNNSFL